MYERLALSLSLLISRSYRHQISMTLPSLAKVFYLVFYSVRFVEATISHSFAES